jgi:hypothetical protein
MDDQTEAEQIFELVAVYYAERGMPIPKQDLADCKALLKAERERNYLPESSIWLKDYVPKPPKPDFGTPEFWAYMRKQKKERLAREAAAKATK